MKLQGLRMLTLIQKGCTLLFKELLARNEASSRNISQLHTTMKIGSFEPVRLDIEKKSDVG